MCPVRVDSGVAGGYLLGVFGWTRIGNSGRAVEPSTRKRPSLQRAVSTDCDEDAIDDGCISFHVSPLTLRHFAKLVLASWL